MHFENHNWMQVDDYLKTEDRVMLVLGACEQHGYLSLLTDVKIPLALANKAAQQSGILVAPPVNFGCSPYFLDYPGTISLRLHTYLDLVEDILCSLYGVGFRRVLILNGHGGNLPVKTHLVELLNQLPDLHLRWYDWWMTPTVERIAQKYDLAPEHGNWLEAFPFTTVVELPHSTKPVISNGPAILGKAETRQTYGDGAFGGAYQAAPEVMKELFEACLADVMKLLTFNEETLDTGDVD
ncbi:MAG: creatininase family protein [Brevefilum sp.]